jgi:membrane-bound lytic murein transglycosylase D
MAQVTALQNAKLTDEEAAGTKVLNIRGKYNAVVMAKNLTMDIAQFNKLNPNFDGLADGNDGYNLRLPADKMELFNANRYIILHECIITSLQNQSLSEYPSESRLVQPKGKSKK